MLAVPSNTLFLIFICSLFKKSCPCLYSEHVTSKSVMWMADIGHTSGLVFSRRGMCKFTLKHTACPKSLVYLYIVRLSRLFEYISPKLIHRSDTVFHAAGMEQQSAAGRRLNGWLFSEITIKRNLQCYSFKALVKPK